MNQHKTRPRLSIIRSAEYGFTLLELLITIVLVGIITTLAMPAMKTVTRRSEALDMASELSRQLNYAKDQAIRRNRAYRVTLTDLHSIIPRGIVSISEAPSNRCQSLLDQPNLVKVLEVKAYGGSTVQDIEPSIRPFVGLSVWRQGEASEWRSNPLELCLNPKGSTFIRRGALYDDLTGYLYIGVQQFFGDPVRPLGPPYQVELSYSSGAKVKR